MRLPKPVSLLVVSVAVIQLSCSSPEPPPPEGDPETVKKGTDGWSVDLPYVAPEPEAEDEAKEPAADASADPSATRQAVEPEAEPSEPVALPKHPAPWLNATPAKPKMTEEELAKLDLSQSCDTAGCHQGVVEGEKHYEIEIDECSECHEKAEGTHAFVTKAINPEELCLDCHDAEEPSTPHTPYAERKCTDCHIDLHAPRPKTEASLCMKCHEKEKLFPAKNVHGPAAVGACAVCHAPHGSDHEKILRKEPKELCLDCHEPMAERLETSSLQHEPAAEECTICHSAHGTDNRANLIDTLPGLCFECHDGIEDLLDENPIHHGAIKAKESCAGCHDPHASNTPALLIKATPKELCLSCHTDPLGKLIGIGQLLKKNPNHHGPIREGECTACHNPHASKTPKLLIKAYPRAFYTKSYAPEKFALCFECHESERFEKERTRKLTGFRDGDRNLHFLHVNRKRKGRTCRSCHDVHASKQPFHITESVPFGSWELPVNFAVLPDGGSCAPGCHKPKEYSRSKK